MALREIIKRIGVVAAAAAVLAATGLLAAEGKGALARDERDGAALEAQTARPAVEAYFMRESYRPGASATLVVDTPLRGVTVQVFRTGAAVIRGRRRDEMRGVAVTPAQTVELGARAAGRRIRVSIGDWPSGVHYAELRAGGRVGYAPFVVAPRTLGEHRVAVVMPTNTWFAYNRRDADGDGEGDTWYENSSIESVDTTRPFLDRGVPPHFGHYDLPFLRWLHVRGKQVDYLSQRELETVAGGDVLARVYDLIVFPGHHEYVTEHEYDVIERYRNLGGNLMFLSANNFFWKVVKRRESMSRKWEWLWRDLGRPEAALIGVQYIGNDRGQHRAPFRVRAAQANEWLFAGTGLEPGSAFGSFGIEIDHTAPSSPPGIEVVAEIPDLFAPGETAQMTYYETPRGARVFAAGAFTLAGQALYEPVSTILENLWTRLAAEAPAPS
jgi:N,N-dimethylformamidase beta subunit-like, C-terminal